MSERDNDNPLQGDVVIYIDEDRRTYAAIVAFVYNKRTKNSLRPICNLAIIKHDGSITRGQMTEPAWFDNSKGLWKMLNKWAWPDEVPAKLLNPSLSETGRTRMVGLGGDITVS